MKFKHFMMATAMLVFSGCGGSEKLEAPPVEPTSVLKPVVIGLSLSGDRLARWKMDEQIIRDRARELGASVVSLSANENSDIQNDQAENLIIQGVDILLVVPHDAEKSSKIVEMAHNAGISVIAYDRIIRHCALDYYVSFDNVKVGRYQALGVIAALDPNRKNRLAYIGGSPKDANSALLKQGAMKVLKPLLKKRRVTLELETFTKDWSSQNAYLDLTKFLSEGGSVDGIIAANDSTASGVIQALAKQGLSGIPVSGQDAELAACQRLVQGTQTMTVYKPLRLLGNTAVDLAMQVVRGLPVETSSSVNNGLRPVPSILLESIPVTRANLNDTVIRDGFHSYDDVYGIRP